MISLLLRAQIVSTTVSPLSPQFLNQPFLQAFRYNVRGHAEPFSIPPLPIIGVSTLTSYTVGRFEGHMCMDNREITQQANPHVVRLEFGKRPRSSHHLQELFLVA
jgi:hypothetical protein